MKENKLLENVKQFGIITLATMLMVFGVYLFKFPNNFTFGGVTGMAVLIARILPISASTATFILNTLLLILGFAFLGRGFGFKTVYVSLLTSAGLWALEKLMPLSAPITDEPVLELIFAIMLPAVSSAILFNIGASSGGTDNLAMIFKKYSTLNIGRALILADCIVAVASFFVFDVKTGLFSACGLIAKSFVIDGVIENINLCKYFTIICDDPKPLCEFITGTLKRSATVLNAEGAFKGKDKSVVITIMKPHEAVKLRNYIRKAQPGAFLAITNSSEIIGKGFHFFS